MFRLLPETTTVARVGGFFRQHARCSPTVGAKSTRPLSFWAKVLGDRLGIPDLTVEHVRIVGEKDARICVDLAGQTNIRAGSTLRAAGYGDSARERQAGGAK